MEIKIAAVTENDNIDLSSHFGRAPVYLVMTARDGQVVAQEQRPKPHHAAHGAGHGEHEHSKGHADMFAPVRDCQVLLVGGMGQPAYEKAKASGLEVILTGGRIDAAVQAYLQGELQSDLRRVHTH